MPWTDSFALRPFEFYGNWAVVVAQLEERSLPTPQFYDSNPVIDKIYIEHLYCQMN